MRFTIVLILLLSTFSFQQKPAIDNQFISFTTTADKIKMYWKKDNQIIGNFKNLKAIEPGLVFAMNGGMFNPDFGPVGLYIENGQKVHELKKYNNPTVNFGLQPQGIFAIRNKKGEVISVDQYKPDQVTYATQSAPMLVIDSKINPQLPKGKNYIRNGVGILMDGRIIMAVSKSPINFHQFAQYFLDNKCISALYLDGAISEAYTGDQETFGSFGVIVGVLK